MIDRQDVIKVKREKRHYIPFDAKNLEQEILAQNVVL